MVAHSIWPEGRIAQHHKKSVTKEQQRQLQSWMHEDGRMGRQHKRALFMDTITHMQATPTENEIRK